MEWKDSLTFARTETDEKNKDSLLPTLANPLLKKLFIHQKHSAQLNLLSFQCIDKKILYLNN